MKRLLCVLLAVLIICSCWVTAGAAEDGTTAPEDKSGGWVFDSQYQLPTQTTEYTAGSGTITWEPTTVYDETHQCEKAASGRLVHMFTTDFNNHHAGETESPKVTNTNSGIQFTVTGLSPIAVGWVKKNSGSGGGGWYPSVSYYDVKVEK